MWWKSLTDEGLICAGSGPTAADVIDGNHGKIAMSQ
jgi:hypothetical protein